MLRCSIIPCLWASLSLAAPAFAAKCDPTKLHDQSAGRSVESQFLTKLKNSKNTAEKTLYKMTEYSGASYLLGAELDRISQIYSSMLPAASQARKSFDIYLQARLATLNPDQANQVFAIVQDAVLNHEGALTDRFSCGFEPATGRVTWRVPKKYQETALAYALLAHETEHAIQWLLLKDLPDFKSMQYVSKKFLQEYGAMKVEGEYLLAIPLEVRRQLLLVVQSEPDSEFKELASNILSAEATSPEAHVTWQWQKNRYSKAIIELWQSFLRK